MALRYIVLGIVVAVVVGAGTAAWILTSRIEPERRISLSHAEGAAAVVPLGLSAGAAPPIAVSTDNPLSSDPTAVEEGRKLFVAMNCAGCHGYDAKGGMGPDLTDTAWRYGGTPIDIYKSIYEGRPQGMPAWGNALPPNSLWQLVAYIQSLGGSFAAPPAGGAQAAAAAQGTGAQAGQKP
jgi:cytochrome c oxidase cbb3-type subunit 3